MNNSKLLPIHDLHELLSFLSPFSASNLYRISLIGIDGKSRPKAKLLAPQNFPDNPIILHQRVQTGSWTIDRRHLVVGIGR